MLMAAPFLSVAMACGERRRLEGCVVMTLSSDMPSAALVQVASGIHTLVPATTLDQAIIDDFSGLPEVRKVAVAHENGEILVRIGVDEDIPRQARYRIYDKQSTFIHAFPEMLFDFSLVPPE